MKESSSLDYTYVRKLAFGGTPAELGGKGFRLSELLRSGFPVPEAFIITTAAYEEWLKHTPLLSSGMVAEPLRTLSPNIASLVHALYKQLFGHDLVVVRSSATVEDSPSMSFAGAYSSILDVSETTLDEAILSVYTSMNSEQAVDYIKRNGISPQDIKMAVVVQKQIDPWFSGICFTANPVSGQKEYVVELVMGRGERLAAGESVPIRFLFDSEKRPSSLPQQSSSELGDLSEHIHNLLKTCDGIESYFGAPQDVEWAVKAGGQLSILQSRDITTLDANAPSIELTTATPILTHGLGLSAGMATGPARKLLNDLSGAEAILLVRPGDILVTYSLRIDHLPALAQCAGVMASDASVLSHPAIRARELGIPYVGGIPDALSLVHEDQQLTIDGRSGIIYNGTVTSLEENESEPAKLIYYNPDCVHVITQDNQTILYEAVDGHVMAYIDKIGNQKMRESAIELLSHALHISADAVVIDMHGIWEGNSSPSLVYDQYTTIERLKGSVKTSSLLEEGISVLEAFDPHALTDFTRRIDRKANRLFKASLTNWDMYLKTSNRSYVSEAAQLLDLAKALSASLVGVAIVDVYGTYNLERHTAHLQDEYRLTLSDILSLATINNSGHFKDHKNGIRGWFSKMKSEGDVELFAEAVQFAQVLQRVKNRRLQVISFKGRSAVDIIDEFVREGFGDIVAQYEW